MKISIVLPVYNVSAYIERCMQSVMSQTYRDIECIIIDDCTKDDSIDKCNQMIAEYKGPIQFQILHHEKNRGISAARNTGTKAAHGDYIIYIDSDDSISNDCIEKLVAPVMRDNTIEMVMGNVEIVYEGYPHPPKNLMSGGCKDLHGREVVRDYFFSGKGLRGYVMNRLINKDFLTRYNITFKEGLMWEDELWVFFVMKHLSHLFILPDITYQYYRRSSSITLGTKYNTIQLHRGMVFYDISSNFTPGDSNREARFYLKDFCHHYLGCIQPELYHQVAHNFRKELTLSHDTSDYLRLIIISLLSKTWIGRKTFYCLKRIYRQLRRKRQGV